MAITIKKIAELANTSRGTVDRVLHARGRVNPDKAKLILKIAEEHGYEFNRYARALVYSKKTFKVGVIINAEDNDFYERVLHGIKKAEEVNKSKQFEYIYKTNSHQDYKKQLKNIDEVLNESVDALLITPVINEEITSKIKELEIPVALGVNRLDLSKDDLFIVACDYESNGRLSADLANILIKNGKILIVSGPKHIKSYVKRNIGFKKYLLNDKIVIDEIYTNDDSESTYRELERYIKNNEEPNLIYFNTYGIDGGLKAIKDFKIKTKIITVDETNPVIDGINAGEIAVTITQQPEKQGLRLVQVIEDYLVLKQKPKNNSVVVGNKIKVKSSNFNENVWTNQ